MPRLRRDRMRRRTAPEAGMVTAELAVALPAVVLTAVVAATFLSAVLGQIRACDAAAVAARLTARGESAAVVSTAVQQVAPGARLSLTADAAGDPLVVAEIVSTVHVAVLGRLLPAFVIRERAVAPREPGGS